MEYPNPFKPGKKYPDRVTLGADGVYRWAYSLNVEESRYVRTVVLLTVGGCCVFLMLFALIIGMESEELLAMLLTLRKFMRKESGAQEFGSSEEVPPR